MELPKSPQDSTASREEAAEAKALGRSVSLFVRLWSYGAPSQPPVGLALKQDADIAALLYEIVRECDGQIAEQQPELWCAHFEDALHTLSAAKTLQQRFLTFHRKAEPQQVVPSILIYPTHPNEEVPGADVAVPADMLANVTSAQILIAESIYEQMKSVPGFRFNSKAVRQAGETFGPEAIYEMLWTDESTYGHLRQASRAGLKTVGRYQIQEELGRGAMGAVCKAYDELIGRTVALKTISIDRNAPRRDELIERLKQEAKAAGGLDHPNIITIYDVGQEDDVVYLSMQHVKGITLASMLAEVGVPSLATFLSWADQICAGVGFAHASGVIHRDLKPANLMVTEEGVIKVLDFGIAKLEDTSMTQTGLVVGTPSYMSPEQLTGKKVDHRADIFALGSVFYELITRERPFQGDVTAILYKIVHEDPVAPSLINPSIPGAIDAVIRKALAKDPKDRFQTCEEMRAAFAEQAVRLHVTPTISGTAVPLKSTPQPAPTAPSYLLIEPEPKRRNVWPLALVLLFVGTAGWAFYVRHTTGSFPQFVDKLLKGTEQSSQTANDHNPEFTTEQIKTAPAEQSTTGHDAEATADPPGAEAAVPDPSVSQAESGNSLEQSSSGVEEGESSKSAPGAASGVAPAIPKPLQATTASAIPGQPSAAGGASTMSAETPGKSPFSPAAKEQPANGELATETAKKPHQAVPTVDGFTRKNIPELLRVAEIAARRGDYRLARYDYKLILKLDPANVQARSGLRLVQESERLR
jgi:serine/threonine protein kinase